MRFYLVQHGDAVSKDIDPDRPLSDKGRLDVKKLQVFLSGHGVVVSQIWHSGKTRARETAELLRPLLSASSEIHRRDGLAPNDAPQAFIEELHGIDEDILVASHMPFVSRTVSQALAGSADRALIDFVPGSIAGIARHDDGSWRLFMFVRPENL